MSFELLLGALLAAAAVVFVAVPFLRGGEPEPVAGEPGREVLAAEERDRILAELKDLEFDHRTGKITNEDYRELVGPLRRQAAEALRAAGPPSPNGEPLPVQAAEPVPQQHFSASSAQSGRRGR